MKSLPIGGIGCLEVPGVDPGWTWDSPEIAQNCHQPKRPKTQLLLFSQIMMGTHPAPQLRSLIFQVRTLFFWLNHANPYTIRRFKFQRPRQKLPIDPLAPYRPSENHQNIGLFDFYRNVGHRPLVTLGWLRCLKSLPIGAIGCLEVPGVDPGWMWDSPEITQNCHQPKRPKTQLLLFPEIMIGPLTRIHLCDFIFGLCGLKF